MTLSHCENLLCCRFLCRRLQTFIRCRIFIAWVCWLKYSFPTRRFIYIIICTLDDIFCVLRRGFLNVTNQLVLIRYRMKCLLGRRAEHWLKTDVVRFVWTPYESRSLFLDSVCRRRCFIMRSLYFSCVDKLLRNVQRIRSRCRLISGCTIVFRALFVFFRLCCVLTFFLSGTPHFCVPSCYNKNTFLGVWVDVFRRIVRLFLLIWSVCLFPSTFDWTPGVGRSIITVDIGIGVVSNLWIHLLKRP